MAVNPTTAPEACVMGLANYLTANVAGLTVFEEWPNPNQVLAYPTLTIFAGAVKTMNLMPEILSTTAPDTNHLVTVTEVVGEHDFTIQLDLWCADKVQRSKYLGLVLNAINGAVGTQNTQGTFQPAGLSLQLANWFNDWVRFDIDGHQLVDDEASAERRERRVRIDLLCNCRDIRQRSYYAIVHADTELATTLSVEMVDDTSGVEIKPAY